MIIYDKINFNRTEKQQKIVEEWIKRYNQTLKEYECYFDLWDKRWHSLQEVDEALRKNLLNKGFNDVGMDYSYERVPVSKSVNGKELWGFSDLEGNIIVEPQYTKVKNFLCGYAWVSDDNLQLKGYYISGIPGNWGLIDVNGNKLIQHEYRYSSTFTNNYHRVSILPEGKKYIRYGLVDDFNNVILPFVLYWDSISSGTIVRQCVAGRYAANDDDMPAYGILDIVTGEWRLPPVNIYNEMSENWNNLDEFEIEADGHTVAYYNVVTNTLRYYEEYYEDIKDYIDFCVADINTEIIKK